MDKVLQDHPNSAKAHYVEAEILAKEGRKAGAASELAAAERLAPGLPFAKPESVNELRAVIAGPGQVQARRGFPWGMFFLGIGAIFVIYFIFRSMVGRSRQATYIPAGGAQPYGAPGYGPGPGYGPMGGGGMGSGILSGLATGAAVGAGMVAGEEIAHHLMDGNGSNNVPVSDSWDTGNMGGQDFGVADNSSWDDGSGGSFADSGGNDWS
ncbi:MAG TPA: tetratricopeptide repeat protein, partial [Burkholderiales bacterium]|nr:tetratricopeptide repeat protein [Burkholderiales bacterium]